jgi:lipopolysaccharide biosynthesis glycosyltransferase
MKQKKCLLVTLADKNYISQAKQLFSSVYYNACWKGDYMLLALEIPENEIEWFRKKGILVKECEPLFKEYFKAPTYSQFTKAYLLKEEFKQWDVIIFLDGDIIVKTSLNKLKKVKQFSAAVDDFPHLLENMFFPANPGDYERLENKYDLDKNGFCSGVFVINTKMINKDTFNRFCYLVHKYKNVINQEFKLGEQPIFNLLFYGKWKPLPFFYDIYYPALNLNAKTNLKNLNGIIHFISETKPWLDKNHPFYEEWLNNLQRAEYIDLQNRKSCFNKPSNWLSLYLNSLHYFKKKYILKTILITYSPRLYLPMRSLFRYFLKT